MARILKNTLNDNALDVNLHGTIGSIYNTIMDFRNPAGKYTSDNLIEKAFATLDQPGTYYFKLFFYFNNPYSEVGLSSNLLGVEYNTDTNLDKGGWGANTALNYLYNNREYTRFRYLAEFIQLLSDINTQSPWYFQSISGLDTALERTEFAQRDFKIEEERKKISIKCLADALDNRIGKLIDLYRAAAYSQMLHKEIIPANLRKFDMGIYIFTPLVKQIDLGIKKVEDKGFWESIGDSALNKLGDVVGDRLSEMMGLPVEKPQYRKLNFMNAGTPQTSEFANEYVSSKYIELRNCEIDLNSSKGPFSEFSNAEGKQNEYEISISFDTCYEQRYDTAFNDVIGDFVIEDLYRLSASETESNKKIVDKIVSGINDDDTFELPEDSNYNGIVDDSELANADMNNTISAIYSGNRTISKMNTFFDYEGDNGSLIASIANGSFKETITGKLEDMASSAANALMDRGATQLKGLLMGNLYGFSLTNDITGFINKASSGGMIFNIADKVENSIGNRIILNQSNFSTDPKDLREGKPLPGYDDVPKPKTHKDGNLSSSETAISESVMNGIGENIYERGNFDNGNLSRGWTKRSISR